MNKIKTDDMLKLIVLSGLAGGMMEILWIALYGFVTPQDVSHVSREVALTLVPAARDWTLAPILGVGVHLMLSVTLSAGFVIFVWQPYVMRFGRLVTLLSATSVLSAIWAVNFYALLPVLNPYFLTLLPTAVTLMSKMLFGLAMGLTLGVAKKSLVTS
jgi:hypothetical protein